MRRRRLRGTSPARLVHDCAGDPSRLEKRLFRSCPLPRCAFDHGGNLRKLRLGRWGIDRPVFPQQRQCMAWGRRQAHQSRTEENGWRQMTSALPKDCRCCGAFPRDPIPPDQQYCALCLHVGCNTALGIGTCALTTTCEKCQGPIFPEAGKQSPHRICVTCQGASNEADS